MKADHIFGKAVEDYFHTPNDRKRITVYSKEAGKEFIYVSYLFRGYDLMTENEKWVLGQLFGKTLDVGACAGPHSLWLQKNNQKVYALESSSACIDVMKSRGIENLLQANFLTYDGPEFDNIILMMNGLGICTGLESLDAFFEQIKKHLKKGGKAYIESTDICYILSDEKDWKGYYIMQYQMQYEKYRSDKFNWLYMDADTFQAKAEAKGLKMDELYMLEEQYPYVMVLKKE